MLGAANLAVRFALELALLAALGLWGFGLDAGWAVRAIVGITAPLIVLVIWGLFVAPKGALLLPEPWRVGLELVLFGIGCLALYRVDQPELAMALGVAALANISLMFVLGQRRQRRTS